MKTLYFNLIGGASGDMIVAAFLDFGVDLAYLKRELKKIKVNGYVLRKSRVERGHVKALKFDVVIQNPRNYSYPQIMRLIKTSRFSSAVKEKILKVYQALFEAEVNVHGHRHTEVRFEQLGDIDSIIDIACACICLDKIGVAELFYSVVPLNHKIAPATQELLKGKTVYFTGSVYENVTPTGMAFLSSLGKQIDPVLKNIGTMGSCGYGAGAFNPAECSNVLCVAELEKSAPGLETDEIQVIEGNIDDMNPQFFEYIFERLFEAGALDVFLTNVIMKKTRPGFLLTVLSNGENLGKIAGLIFDETTTLGVRFYPVRRLIVRRKIETLQYKGRRIRVKVASLADDRMKIAPEYEDCKMIAQATGAPVSKVYREIQQKAEKQWRFQG